MAISLKKGQGISLRKEENNLDEVIIGLGWDVAEPKFVAEPKSGGIFGSLFGKKGTAEKETAEYDLDAIAVLLGRDGKMIRNTDVVFYNQMQHPSGCATLTGDNRTGAGDGDDEQIIVRLNSLPAEYDKIVFLVAIYEGRKNAQSFGEVENCFIRMVDQGGKELVRYDISGNASFAAYRSIVFAEVQREGSGWNFRAIGQPHETDSFGEIVNAQFLRKK